MFWIFFCPKVKRWGAPAQLDPLERANLSLERKLVSETSSNGITVLGDAQYPEIH